MALDPVTTVLVSKLDRDLRFQVLSRRENMLRELRFLEERRDPRLLTAHQHQWTNERLEVLCGLNAFYQLVLGPLASSARDRFGFLGRDIPILYGETVRFDSKRSSTIQAAHSAFMSALDVVPVATDMLTAPHFDDLLFRLIRFIEGRKDV